MNPRTALARLTGVAAGEIAPLARRLVARARRVADDVATRILGDDFEDRIRFLNERYARLGGDPFGLNADTARSAVMLCAFFHRLYFRTEVSGLENVPQGRCLLVANHSGQIPIDAAIIGSALFLDANPPRVTRAMVDKWTVTLPFVSTFFSRVGQVVGVPENARRLLIDMDELLLAFPEGLRGIAKPFSRRYQLEDFGLGFMRLALETSTPIVPVAVIGAEEQYINFGNLAFAARALRIPVFPLVPQVFLPGGQLPLPMKYRLIFGEPLRFHGDPEEDDAALEDRVWIVRQAVQQLLNRGLSERSHLFY